MKIEYRISTGHLNPKQTSTASNRLSKTIRKWEPPASAPPGATLLGSSEQKPSGIPVATVCDRGAVVSSSFPTR
jgi:hypothetical protein